MLVVMIGDSSVSGHDHQWLNKLLLTYPLGTKVKVMIINKDSSESCYYQPLEPRK